MITYKEWNKAIIKHIFENCEPGEIVFLNTTPETLKEIAEEEGFNVDDAVESLKEAVRKEVLFANKVELYKIRPVDLQNDQPEKEPTQVAFLALTVLAASQMDSEGSVAPNDYYSRLNHVLFGKLIKKAPAGFYGHEFEWLWIHLLKWSIYQHKVQLYLTVGSSTRRYVWYPISQCLISKHDENKLHAIFKEAELKPGAYLAEKQLLDILCSKKTFQKLSVKITRPVEQQKTAEVRLILGQIQLLLKNWDGEVWETIRRGTTRQNSTSISVHLFDLPDDIDEICFWFKRRQNSQITFKHNPLNVETLQLSDDDQWYEPYVMPANLESFQILQNGTELKTTGANSFAYRIKPSDIWVFRWDEDHAVAWLSEDDLLLHEEHLIVYREQLKSEVISFLEQVCDNVPTSKPIRIRGKETGWQYIKVKPIKFSDLSLSGFRITTKDQIEFVGGLSLSGQRNSYIDFCLPTIVVPNLLTNSNELFYMNEQPVDIPSNRKIELPDQLDSDQYHLSYLDCHQPTLHIITPRRLTEYQYKSLTTELSTNRETIPTYSKETIVEITEKPGVWLAGAQLFGTDIPETTWDNVVEVPIELQPSKDDKKIPAQIISSVVKLAIELKKNDISIPEGFNETIQYLEENVAMRVLVQKKLQQYKEKALSFDDLCRYI